MRALAGFCATGGQQKDRLRPGDEQRQEKTGQALLPAQQKAAHGHELDIAPAEGPRHRKGDEQQRQADADRADEPRGKACFGEGPEGGQGGQAEKQGIEVRDFHGVSVLQGDEEQHEKRRQGHGQPAPLKGEGREAERRAETAAQLGQGVGGGHPRAAMAAAPAQQQPAEKGNQFGRAQRVAAGVAMAAALVKGRAAGHGGPLGHHLQKAGEAGPQDKTVGGPQRDEGGKIGRRHKYSL